MYLKFGPLHLTSKFSVAETWGWGRYMSYRLDSFGQAIFMYIAHNSGDSFVYILAPILHVAIGGITFSPLTCKLCMRTGRFLECLPMNSASAAIVMTDRL